LGFAVGIYFLSRAILVLAHNRLRAMEVESSSIGMLNRLYFTDRLASAVELAVDAKERLS
jgi:hypothetical protein